MTELYKEHERELMEPEEGGPEGPPRGYGHYSSYHALWHLREIGVVEDLVNFRSEGWDAAEARPAERERPTRVALVDTSVVYDHPNLEGAILKDLMIDFFSARLGTFPCPGAESTQLDEVLDGAEAKAAEIEDEVVRKLFSDLRRHLKEEYGEARSTDWRRPLRVLPTTSATFSAHGTAMAGLIGARPRGPEGPEGVQLMPTPHIGGSAGQPASPKPEVYGFPYVGVDPFCEIVPISTSFDPDPEQLILAMLYAWMIDADVIVLARDFPDPIRSPVTGEPGPELGEAPEKEQEALHAAYPADLRQEERDAWLALRRLTLKVSERIPMVCASGNGGDATMILPAALAHPENGIIAVGARAATGQRAGYSTTAALKEGGSAITLYAPSGDGDRIDWEMQRVDAADPNFRPGDHSAGYLGKLGVQHPVRPYRHEPDPASTFATQEIITTDVPGATGYNGSAFGQFSSPLGKYLDYRSYYCHFSGTSAAAAIVAGMLSLGISAGKIDPRKARDAKRLLRGGDEATNDGAATPSLHWSNLSKV